MHKKYIKQLLFFFISSVSFILLFNYLIDPYGYQSRDNKFLKNLTMFNKPNVTNSRLKSEGFYYLIGSSRMARVDPKVIESITRKKTHNIKIDGSTLYENSLLATKVKENQNYFIYSFDAFSLNKSRERYKEIKNRSQIFNSKLNENIFFTKYFNGDITIRSIQHLIKFLNGENIDKQYLEENSRDSLFNSSLALNNSGVQNNLDKSNFSNYQSYSDKAIIKLALIGKKGDIFIVLPKYIYYYSLFSKYQNIEKQYFDALRLLVLNTEAQVWSFYGDNKISRLDNNFIDNGWHFKPKVSNIIFNEVFANDRSYKSKIGHLLTKENINDYLDDMAKNFN